MENNNNIYVTPLSGRYPSKEMNELWSNDSKYSTWRTAEIDDQDGDLPF